MENLSYAKSIDLPTDEIFANLKNAKSFAIDIGGSLAKLAYYSTVIRKRSLVFEADESTGDDDASIYKIGEGQENQDQLHFVKFETKYIETLLDFVQKNLIAGREFMKDKRIKVTGGGAYKYRQVLTEKLGAEVDKEDEMACLITGCNFLLKNIADESFQYQRNQNPEYQFLTPDPETLFPYMLVNIGSGTSILKVESDSKYERIGGTSLGGGTFWGLGSILTKARGFDELLELAQNGDHRNIDMLVKDIYGGSYDILGLPGDVIASSFGKAARSARDRQQSQFRDADVAKSLLISISNEIGQIACLHAKLHGLKKIYFGGFFIRGHPFTMHTISFAVNYWSKGEVQALFLRHEGYLGAVGAFMKGIKEEETHRYVWSRQSWGENLARSSGLQSPSIMQEVQFPTRPRSSTFDMLELDRFAKPLVNFPLLLDAASYLPDTVDLTQDEGARQYWLQCFEDAIDKFAERAIASQPSQADAEFRARRFKEKYVRRLHELRSNPYAYGSLTVRNLLDTREHCMEEFHFVDPYSQQKQQESEQALKLLAQRLKDLDSLPSSARHLALVTGMMAGNVFDWGAREVTLLMESQSLGLEEALEKLEKRPWLVDDFDQWRHRIETGPAHKCAVLFVDNSGMDIILGIFPFARDLLTRGTKVVLCANSRPALNDVTYNEVRLLTKKVGAICPIVAKAITEGRLLVMESGQGSPCLDLRYVDFDLAERLREYETDLVVLEGMGRAIHTNYTTNFSCDSIKTAVLKNRWLAERLGGDMFSCIFKYQPSTCGEENEGAS